MPDVEFSLSREHFAAAVFDLDGVVTRTVEVHADAWKQLFDNFMNERLAQEGEDLHPFDSERDYSQYIDGRPRYQGVKHFLSARHIDLPMGEPDDPPESETVCGLGNRKNKLFQQIVHEHGVAVYECALTLIHRLRKSGFKIAMVTASKNCDLILERVGIAQLFDTRIDADEAERLDLDGKPDPDTLLEAARRLGVLPKQTVVFEDVVAGVTAAKRGRFGMVVGVDRGGQRQALMEHGADQVFEQLCVIQVEGHSSEEGFMPPLLRDFTRISQQLTGKRLALFLDYDGTLAPNTDQGNEARLSQAMRRVLQDAAALMPVALISGRSLADLQERVQLPELIYAGRHGFDIQGPGLRLELPAGLDTLEDLAQAATTLEAELVDIGGAWLERKRFMIAVHYRQVADADLERLTALVDKAHRSYPRLRRTAGKKLFELRPDIDWDKGRALSWLLSELKLDKPDVMPIYLGDDQSDEDAFRTLHGRGIGVLVSDRPRQSLAVYRIEDTRQVIGLLRFLIERVQGHH
ncbi:MAG: trehalose-phosphatase [Chromatiales bacterium]|jgi:alpha,alpha-trehalase